MEKRPLLIAGLIGRDCTYEQVRSQLEGLDRQTPLAVEINSDGGSVQDASAIFNLLKTFSDVEVTIVGWALSAASLIAMAGKRVRAFGSSLIMVHAPWLDGASGNAGELRASAEMLDQVAKAMRSAYGRTGQSPSIIDAWLGGKDHWFTASEALAVGLVDEVIEAGALAAAPADIARCRFPVPPNLQRSIIMSQANANQPAAAGARSEADIQAAALAADRERRTDIRRLFAKFAAQPGVAELQRQCEDDHAVTVDAAGQRLLAKLADGASPISGGYTSDESGYRFAGRIEASGDQRERDFISAAIDGQLLRAGVRLERPHPLARDLARTSILGVAERCLSMRGLSTRGAASDVIQAAHTSSDFSTLLSGLTAKALRVGYANAPASHAVWTGEREVDDFKLQTLAMLGEAPSLEQVPEGSEYKLGSFAESGDTFAVSTYGKIFAITRQALINDDLNAFAGIPNAQGQAARRLESDMVYGKLHSTANLKDGKPLFHADHKNLAAAGAALSVDALGAARAAMRKQRGIGGVEYIDPAPRFLIVPVALETKAEALIASTVNPAASNNAENPEWVRRLVLVADPRLDTNSETAWYLATDPGVLEGIIRAYLRGEPRPYLEEDDGWRRDTKEFKVRLDLGVGIVDYRALYKNPGA